MLKARKLWPVMSVAVLVTMASALLYLSYNPNAAKAEARQASEPKTLRILWTNDTHGYLSPLYHKEPEEGNYLDIAVKEGKIGGWANLATLIKKYRAEMPGKTLLLDAGDTWHGTGVALFTRGSAIVRVMNALKYDAMTPGNVDFLYPKEVFLKLVEESEFPVIAANIYDKEWDEPDFEQYIIKEVNGLKVAIIGMTYHWSAKTGNRKNTQGWSFGLREDQVRELIKEIREKKKPDLVVLLSHMGFRVDRKYPTRVKGIDVVVGAHTHDNVYEPPVIDGTIVVQAGSHGKFLGKLDLKIKDGKVVGFDNEIIRVVDKDIPDDKEIQKIILEEYAPFAEKLKKIIGRTKTLIYRRATYQSTMDNLITDAYREMYGADVSFSPSWRFGLTVLPGEITVEDVYGMVPTDEPVMTFELKGNNIKFALESAVENVLAEEPYEQLGGDLVRFSGMEVIIDETKPFRKRVVSLRIGGKPYEPEKMYKIVTANTQMPNVPTAQNVKNTGKVAVEELIRYIEKKKVIAPKLDGRVKIAKKKEG